MNQADTAWMLISTALVLLMTPALAFFYGGLVRTKNALNTMMMSWAGAAVLVCASGITAAQNYPDHPIRVVVPFPPGGSVDVIARLVAPKLAENLGQQIVIDNRGGASGNIGAAMVAHSPPDGYTLLAHTVPFTVNPFLYSTVPYDANKDFTPISLLSHPPQDTQEVEGQDRIEARSRQLQHDSCRLFEVHRLFVNPPCAQGIKAVGHHGHLAAEIDPPPL